jgi:hypothetical protein
MYISYLYFDLIPFFSSFLLCQSFFQSSSTTDLTPLHHIRLCNSALHSSLAYYAEHPAKLALLSQELVKKLCGSPNPLTSQHWPYCLMTYDLVVALSCQRVKFPSGSAFLRHWPPTSKVPFSSSIYFFLLRSLFSITASSYRFQVCIHLPIDRAMRNF